MQEGNESKRLESHQIFFNSRSSDSNFEGICMDDRAQKSVAGLPAYKRYCRHKNTPLDLTPSNEKFKLGKEFRKVLEPPSFDSLSIHIVIIWNISQML